MTWPNDQIGRFTCPRCASPRSPSGGFVCMCEVREQLRVWARSQPSSPVRSISDGPSECTANEAPAFGFKGPPIGIWKPMLSFNGEMVDGFLYMEGCGCQPSLKDIIDARGPDVRVSQTPRRTARPCNGPEVGMVTDEEVRK